MIIKKKGLRSFAGLIKLDRLVYKVTNINFHTLEMYRYILVLIIKRAQSIMN